MSYTPIPEGTENWDVPVNAAFTDQDTRIDQNAADITTLEGSVSGLRQSWNSVKDFGAVGDGVADDTIAIQNAIDAGGITYFPAGTYLTTTLTPLAGTVLTGVGRNGYIPSASSQLATLKLKNGTNASMIVGGDQISNVMIRYLNFDGNQANNSSGDIIHLNDGSAQDTAWHIYDCFFDVAPHDGIYIGTGRQAVKMSRTWIMRSANNGVTVNGADVGLETMLIGLSGSNGVYLGAWVAHLVGCDIWSAGSNGILCDNVHMISITNCGLDRHGQSAIVVQTGGSVAISNNMFHSNSQSANNTYPHIQIGSGQVAITGNTFATDGLANNPNYCINITGGTLREWANNQISGSFVTGYINNAALVNNFVTGSLSLDSTRQVNVGGSGSGATFVANRTNATDGLISGRITGDTVNRFSATVGGSVSWGPGGAGAQDVTLARTGASQLQLTLGTLDMASKKITAVANGTAATDAAAFGQIPVAGTTSTTYTAGNDNRVLQAFNNDKLQGFLAVNYEPETVSGTAGVNTSGTIYLHKVYLAQGQTVNNLAVGVQTAGSTLTAGQNFLGLYDSTGARVGLTADQASSWTSTGYKSAALTAPYSVTTAGFFYVAVLAVGTTPPAFYQAANAPSALFNANTAAGTFRHCTDGTGQTSLPSSITLGSTSSSNVNTWVAAL